MKTLAAIIKDFVAQNGYNPYSQFRDAHGTVYDMSEVLGSDTLVQKLKSSLLYQCLVHIRSNSINEFFKYLDTNFYPNNDNYITGLMLEILRRCPDAVQYVKRITFSDSAYIEFDTHDEFLTAYEQLKPHFPWMQAYERLSGGIFINYQAMDNKYLLNAFFQRAYNDFYEYDAGIQMLNLDTLRLESPTVDGMSMFVAVAMN